MAFNEYPYTDFHEMNLDWVIKKVKELAAAWAQVQQDWTDEQAAFANLQSWIENYFNNLNVQTEINVKLDAMVAAGTMSELIAPYVASGLPAEVAEQIGDVVAAQIGPVVAAQISAVVADQLPAVAAAAAAQEVSAWLALHVNPETGYVIDDTFTVQGAAADAKAVGDEFTAIKSALTDLASSNFLIKDKTYTQTAGGSSTATSWSTVVDTIDATQLDAFVYSCGTITTDYAHAYTAKLGLYTYQADDTLIARNNITLPKSNEVFQIPDNCAYVNVVIVVTNATDAGINGSTWTLPNFSVVTSRFDYDITNKVFIQNVNDIPNYWMTHLNSKLSYIQTANAKSGRYGDSFVFLTDPHWETNTQLSLNLVRWIAEHTNNKLLVCGGDILNERSNTALAKLFGFTEDAYAKSNGNYRYILGNHDKNTMGSGTGTELTWDEVYSATMKPFENDVEIYGNDDVESFIYHWDNARQRIRYIVLNTGTAIQFGYNYEPLDTLIRSTPSGWKIGVFAHGFYSMDGTMTTSGAYVAGMLDAVNGRTSYTFYGRTYDYSALTCEVMFAICGHTHQDLYTKTMNGVPIIGVTTDNYERDETSGVTRHIFTTEEQAFDCVDLDTANRKIYLTRIGYGSNREYTWEVAS